MSKPIKIGVVGLGRIGMTVHKDCLKARPDKYEVVAADLGIEYAYVEQDECFHRDPFDCLKMSLDYLKSIGYEA